MSSLFIESDDELAASPAMLELMPAPREDVTHLDDDNNHEAQFHIPDEDLDDGLGSYLTPDLADEIYIGDQAGAGENVHPAPDSNLRTWAIDQNFGQYHFRWDQLIARTSEEGFDGAKAIDMLQQAYTIDFAHSTSGSLPVADDDELFPIFYLDYISIIGRPLRPVSKHTERFFDNVTISLQHWHAPYTSKHHADLPFEIRGRTFRIASGASQELWFIVMHPVRSAAFEQPTKTLPRVGTAMAKHHAQALASQIVDTFSSGDLLDEGIEPSWLLGGSRSQIITYNKWVKFQHVFMNNWASFSSKYLYDSFWTDNQPAFHAFNFGANIEIEANDQVEELQPETLIRQQVTDDPNDYNSVHVGVNETVDMEMDTDMEATTRMELRRAAMSDQGYHQSTCANDEAAMYGPGLQQLLVELEQKYDLESLETFSYALAVNIHCLAGPSAGCRAGQPACLLVDRNKLGREYASGRDYTFFPLAFHPAHGNFSSPAPPAFLSKNQLAITRDNMSYENEGADVVQFTHCQVYSNIKRPIRHSPDDLLASKGLATAALTLPSSEAARLARVRTKQQRILDQLDGQLTPDNPDASTPFARERQQIVKTIAEQEFAIRFEQVVCIQVQRLVRARRSFRTVLRPIFQLMRFFLQEKQYYTPILRKFPPAVFPGILTAYASIFELAVDEMKQRFYDHGAQGLGLALAEGIGALERLGNFCFTGNPRVLPSRVFRPLETLESLKRAGWPYINPDVLDLRHGSGRIHIAQWPRTENGRPILLHIASLAYHYGQEIADSCHSQLWFRELGGKSIQGISTASRFVEEVLRDLWVPEMQAFISHQLHKRLNQAARMKQTRLMITAGSNLQKWEESEQPFRWSTTEQLIGDLITFDGTQSKSKIQSTVARSDFVQDLYTALIAKDPTKRTAFAPTNSSWFSILRAGIQHTSVQTVNKSQWIDTIAAAMLAVGIEWSPGRHRQRLTHKRIIRLAGTSIAKEALVVRPGTLKRAALEARQNMLLGPPQNRIRQQRIDFGCDLPFRDIPRLVKEGFDKLDLQFERGDKRIREHYQKARNSVGNLLGDPLCNLMLMLVLTIASSSVTPHVAKGEHAFSPSSKPHNPANLAANLVTRMLWFFKRDWFPWKEDDGQILRIPEMTKKIEHKGVSNRMLLQLGWIQVKDSRARNGESYLAPEGELITLYNELMYLRTDPAMFIGRIFGSSDKVWLERCSSLLRDVED